MLNANKSKIMLFSPNRKELPSYLHKLLTAQGVVTEMVSTSKYLGDIIDQNLSFKSHIENLIPKLKPNEVSS